MNLPPQPWDDGPADPPTCPDCGDDLNEDNECESCSWTPDPDPRECIDTMLDALEACAVEPTSDPHGRVLTLTNRIVEMRKELAEVYAAMRPTNQGEQTP